MLSAFKEKCRQKGGEKASSKAPSVCMRAVPPAPAATNNPEDREERGDAGCAEKKELFC